MDRLRTLTPFWVLGRNAMMLRPRSTPMNASATDLSDRSAFRLCVALLAALALTAGFIGVGHDHSSDESLVHHCALCHVQQTVLEPIAIAALSPELAPQGPIPAEDQRLATSFDSGLTPPLRGPPVS